MSNVNTFKRLSTQLSSSLLWTDNNEFVFLWTFHCFSLLLRWTRFNVVTSIISLSPLRSFTDRDLRTYDLPSPFPLPHFSEHFFAVRSIGPKIWIYHIIQPKNVFLCFQQQQNIINPTTVKWFLLIMMTSKTPSISR